MADTVTEAVLEDFDLEDSGGGGGGGGGVSGGGLFDGIVYPRITVQAAVGTVGAGSCVRGSGVRGTSVRGGVDMAEITVASTGAYALRSFGRRFGRPSPIDSADVGTATLVFNNGSGDYDPSNPASPYLVNRLTANQGGLELGTTDGWAVGGSCTIAASTTWAHSSTWSLRLTSTVSSGGIWANTTPIVGGIRLNPGDQVKASAWFRSATRSVSGIVVVMFWDQGGEFIAQTNAPGVATATSGPGVQGSVVARAPNGTYWVSAQVLFDSVIAVGEQHYADDIALQTSALTVGTQVQVDAEWPLGMYWPQFTGEITSIVVDAGLDPTVTITLADGQEKLGRTQLPTEQPEFGGDLPGARMHNLADRAAWPTTLRAIDAGYSTLQSTTLGATAAELMRQVEMTEMGLLFINHAASGLLTFYDRHRTSTASRSATVQLRLTDTSGAGEVGMVELLMSRDRASLYNDIHLTRDPDPAQDPELTGSEPGDEPQEQSASDAVSIAANGNLNLPADLGKLHSADGAVLAQAQGLVARYGTVTDRIEQVTINALHHKVTDEDLWPTLLALTLLDRLAVSRDYGPNTIAGELLIQQLEQEVNGGDAPTWEYRLTTASPPPAPAAPICIRGSGVRGTAKRVW